MTNLSHRNSTFGLRRKTVLGLTVIAVSAAGCGTGLVSDPDEDVAIAHDSAGTGGSVGTGGSLVTGTGGAPVTGMGGAIAVAPDASPDLSATLVDVATVVDAPPSGLILKAISAGYSTACGSRSDDSVICWGGNAEPRVIGTYKSVAVGGSWNCGLRMDGNVVCFDGLGSAIVPAPLGGKTDAGDPIMNFQLPPAGPFETISTGYARGCGVKTDGSLACWGVNAPDDHPPAGTFTSVSVGDSYACAIRTDGTATCWNQLGTGTVVAPDGVRFTSISAGVSVVCGVLTDGTLACWGGAGAAEATPPAGTFTAVAVGNSYACGIKTDQTLVCWGDNQYGRARPPAGTFTALATGYEFACAIKTDGAVTCWGNNTMGQTTPNKSDPSKPDAGPDVPAQVTPTVALEAVSSGYGAACGIKLDGTLICWGARAPAKPPAGTFTSISGWGCARRTDGAVICWDPLTGDVLGPTPDGGVIDGGLGLSAPAYPPSGNYTSVSGGDMRACALKVDGSVVCWGLDCTDLESPPSETFASISAGSSWACGVTTNNKLACWDQCLMPPGSFAAVWQLLIGERRQHLRLRATHQRRRHLLGRRFPERRDATVRNLHGRQHRWPLCLRHQDRRHHRLLGRQHLWPGHATVGNLHLAQRGLRIRVRHQDRQQRRVLGQQRVGRVHAARAMTHE